VEAPDGSIGTPLDNAIGYACWHVARLLVQRGAKVDKLWHAAGLGMLDRLEELLDGQSSADQEALSQAFWHACAAGQRRESADLDLVVEIVALPPAARLLGVSLGTRLDRLVLLDRKADDRPPNCSRQAVPRLDHAAQIRVKRCQEMTVRTASMQRRRFGI
jgi:hypothetical protein